MPLQLSPLPDPARGHPGAAIPREAVARGSLSALSVPVFAPSDLFDACFASIAWRFPLKKDTDDLLGTFDAAWEAAPVRKDCPMM